MKTLSDIQGLVKVAKGHTNKFGNYKYRKAEDILEAVKPVINPLGYHLTISDEVINIGDRYYIQSTATLSNGTNTYKAVALAREEYDKKGMDHAQITGAASSYARKYALCGLFAIDDSAADPDATNTHGRTQEPAPANAPAKQEPTDPTYEIQAKIEAVKTLEGLIAIYNANIETCKNSPALMKQLAMKRATLTEAKK